jgi:DNA-binding protein Fis
MATDQLGDTTTPDPATMALLARRVADLVPPLVDKLLATGSESLYRDAARLFEGPLLAHVLGLTSGNQLRAARVLGLNRNTLRKRCRELNLALPRGGRRPRRAPVAVAGAPAVVR